MLLSSTSVTRAHREAKGSVSWVPGAQTCEDEKDRVEVEIDVQPETKLPKCIVNMEVFGLKLDCHPFWHIRRSCVAEDFNCELHEVKTTLVHTSSFETLKKWNGEVTASGQSYDVMLPYIGSITS